ncbi:MAG: hypothetical protein DMG65_26295 [Candidatus Angelobacter sp. Gp1-AA117]|nr:MAG: hypothetical protein DMG65_26295 [Candidatus Angelobacter sp. Gp1-AA117]
MPAARKAPSKANADFKPVFAALQQILKPYEGRLKAVHDNPDYYYLETHEPTYKNRRMFFAAVRTGRNYVSYHLMPVYGIPELQKSISPALKKRMQGKACFNFTQVDEACFKELAALTKEGFAKFKNIKFI